MNPCPHSWLPDCEDRKTCALCGADLFRWLEEVEWPRLLAENAELRAIIERTTGLLRAAHEALHKP